MHGLNLVDEFRTEMNAVNVIRKWWLTQRKKLKQIETCINCGCKLCMQTDMYMVYEHGSYCEYCNSDCNWEKDEDMNDELFLLDLCRSINQFTM